MKTENENKLYEKFNFINEKYLIDGVCCGDGWFGLLYDLCIEIEKSGVPKDFIVSQIKEKFGGLRFYVSSCSNEVFDLIDKAEQDSYTICERCGKDGKLRDNMGWMMTLCDECNRMCKVFNAEIGVDRRIIINESNISD